jgi:hypothetical protein
MHHLVVAEEKENNENKMDIAGPSAYADHPSSTLRAHCTRNPRSGHLSAGDYIYINVKKTDYVASSGQMPRAGP